MRVHRNVTRGIFTGMFFSEQVKTKQEYCEYRGDSGSLINLSLKNRLPLPPFFGGKGKSVRR